MIDTMYMQARHDYFNPTMLQAYADSLPIEFKDKGEGVPRYAGKLKLEHGTLTVTLTINYVRIVGSLCKAVNGNNFVMLQHSQLVDTLELIADVFGLPLEVWHITRIDVATNLLMSKPPVCYMNVFGNLQYYRHLPMQEYGVYYKQMHREVNIYDKIAEAKRKRERVPNEFADLNVLRIECRAKNGARNVRDAYKLNEAMTAAMLCNKDFFENVIVLKYLNLILSITLLNDMEININNLNSLKDIDKMGRAALIEKAGGITMMLQLIDRQRAKGAITRKQASDLRKAFKKIAQDEALLLPNDEARELSDKLERLPDELMNQ